MSRETNMTVGRPTKLILGLAVPLILTNVGQQLYTVADASIVGRGVGVEALAALGATDWLYWLVLWTVQAMTQGFTTAPMLSGLTEFAGRVGASLLLTKAIGERGLFYTDAAAWTFAAVFLAASYYIQLLIIRKKGLTYQNTK